MVCVGFFFFKQKTAYEMLSGDWSSDVCSSDLVARTPNGSGASMISAVSDSNSRTTLSGGVSLRSVLPERNDFMRRRPGGVKVTVLQVPQSGKDVAPLEELLVGSDVVHRAALEHEDVVRHDHRGE